jgi:RNA polymerase sigma factor (sigma-70 family)
MRKQPCDSYLDTSDDALVKRSLAGDHAAFASLVERYHAQLVGYIAHRCGDESVVSDILQQVMLQLYVSLPTLRADPSLKAWLMRVAHNRCADERRHSRLVPFSRLALTDGEEDLPPVEALPDPAPLPEELAEQHEIQQRVQQAIRALPLKQRSVVWMRYAGQLSYAEIARRLHIPVATAKTNFMRAKPLLRQLLAEESACAVLSARP